MPLPLWALMAGSSAIKAGVNWYSGNKQASRMGQYATDLSKVTPNEREYMKRQRDIAEGGDPFQNQLMQEQMNRVMGNIRQTGAEHLQRAEGSIIGQGMEKSIVASDIRRKVQKHTLRNISEQSRRISAENRVAQEQTKRQAEERRFQMQQSVDQRKFQAMGMRAQMPSRGERNMQLLGSLAQTGVEAYGGYQAGATPDTTLTSGTPWEGLNYNQIQDFVGGMDEERFGKWYDEMKPGEQIKFRTTWDLIQSRPQTPKVPYGDY